MAREITIREERIRLGQLLKLAGVVDSGSEVKALLANEPVLVNGERESRRGRQLARGDTVRVGDEDLLVAGGARTEDAEASPTPDPAAGSAGASR